MDLQHKCPQYEAFVQPHKFFGCGMALWDTIYWDEQSAIPTARDHPNLVRRAPHWSAGNDEYGTPVRFCPWCGLDLWTLKKPEA